MLPKVPVTAVSHFVASSTKFPQWKGPSPKGSSDHLCFCPPPLRCWCAHCHRQWGVREDLSRKLKLKLLVCLQSTLPNEKLRQHLFRNEMGSIRKSTQHWNLFSSCWEHVKVGPIKNVFPFGSTNVLNAHRSSREPSNGKHAEVFLQMKTYQFSTSKAVVEIANGLVNFLPL